MCGYDFLKKRTKITRSITQDRDDFIPWFRSEIPWAILFITSHCIFCFLFFISILFVSNDIIQGLFQKSDMMKRVRHFFFLLLLLLQDMSLVLHLTGLLSLFSYTHTRVFFLQVIISHSLMSGILSNHVHLVNICILYLLFYKKKV